MRMNDDPPEFQIEDPTENLTTGAVASVGAPGKLLQVPVERIRPYEHNPRITPNPRREAIKEAIRASGGLIDPLPVVQRPGDDAYMVSEGGNTRLEVVKELKDETPPGDKRFDAIPILVRPFKSNLHMAALHERENAARGDLTFFERCLSLYNQYNFFLEEYGGKRQQTRFVKHMKDAYGVAIDQGALSRAIRVVEWLQTLIPTCLKQGAMTSKAVRALMTYLAGVRRVWLEKISSNDDEYWQVVEKLLRRQDEDHREELSYADDVDVRAIGLAIDYEKLKDEFVHEFFIAVEDESVTKGMVINWLDTALHRSMNVTPSLDVTVKNTSEEVRRTARPTPIKPVSPVGGGKPYAEPEPLAPAKNNVAAPRRDAKPNRATEILTGMRRRAFEMASAIAERRLPEGFVVQIDSGYGFLLTEMLDDDIPVSEHRADRIQIAAWWALAFGGGVLSAPRDVIEGALPELSVLRQCLEQDAENLIAHSMLGNKFEVALRLVGDLPEEDFNVFFELFALRRRIHITAVRSGGLWNT